MKVLSRLGLIVPIIFFISGCGLFSPVEFTLSSNAEETVPSVAAATSRAAVWGDQYYKSNMQMMYYVFSAIDEEGKSPGGTINFFSVLYDTESIMNDLVASSSAGAGTGVQVDPSFDFGTAAKTYLNTATRSYTDSGSGNTYNTTAAYTIDGTNTEGVFGCRMVASDGTVNYSSTLFEYDETSGTFTLHYAMFNDYPSGSTKGDYYYTRSYITGNMLTHEFFVQVQVAAGNMGDINIIGKGVSQGTGSKYVMYIDNYYKVETGESAGYFLLNGGASETDFQTMDMTPAKANYSDLSADATITSYGKAVSDYIAAGNMFNTDLTAAQFSNGGLLEF